ncbi:hypothetical protein TcCL_NonESM11923 [Trypanosoma cruzi]|nr:hypothetical protein TcCL_NonESM11923 [Trypanosoma cruzi]
MRQLVHVAPRSALLLVLLVVMMSVMCCACGCFAVTLACSCSIDKAMRAASARSIPAVLREVSFWSRGNIADMHRRWEEWMGAHPRQCVDRGPGWHQEVLQLGAALRNEFIE